MSMDAHASVPQGYKDAPTNFRNPYQSQPFFQPMNPPTGIFLGSAVSQNLSYAPMYQGFFPNHPGSQVGYQNPPSFMFRERRGKVNWRNIASLDVDEMVGKGDIRMLESYLANICFANIEEEDVERIGDVNLLKLFRLSQYSLEYLLNCQNYLANQSQALEYQYKLSHEQLNPLEEQVKKNHAEILRLKNDIGEHKGLLASYQNTLSTPMYKCHLCSKLFKSQDFLNNHFKTRHPDAFQSKNKNKVESSVQTQNPQQDNAAVIEKLMAQLKENENAKLSQMTSTLQARLQEVVQSNKELTAKVAEMEKKMVQGGEAGSPDQPFNRTIRREHPTIETGESLNQIQSKQTPKKTERPSTPESPSKQVFRAGDLEEADEERHQQRNQQQKFNAGSLKDIEEEQSVKREGQQKFNAGSLKDIDDDQKSQRQERQGHQAFNAGSLKDVDDEEEGEIRQTYGSIEMNKAGSSEIRHTANRIQDQKSYTKQAFNSGSLKDFEDDGEVDVKKRASRTSIEKKQTFNAGSLHDLDTEEAKTQGSLKEIKNVDGTKPYKRQTFHAGELESDTTRTKAKDTTHEYRAGELEDDRDDRESVGGKNRKRSQEDMVIMEEHEEEEAGERRKGSYDRDNREVRQQTEEKDEDEIREAHKNAVIKATNLIRNKYQHPITQDDYDKAQEQVQKDLKKKSKDLLKTEYTDLKDQNLNDLHVMQNKLVNLNKKDMIQFDRLEREFYEQTSEPVHQPNGQERRSQEAPNRNNKMAQSNELMNLVVDPERKGKDLKTSVDSDPSKKKQIFEPQSNLTKKNIQAGEAEYL